MQNAIQYALEHDETIDITTTGRHSGEPRRVEIWFRRVEGRTFITGTPGPRDWYANLLANPDFIFHFKKSAQADLTASAQPILDPGEKRRILNDPVMKWYHDQGHSLDDLTEGSPLIEVFFNPPLVLTSKEG